MTLATTPFGSGVSGSTGRQTGAGRHGSLLLLEVLLEEDCFAFFSRPLVRKVELHHATLEAFRTSCISVGVAGSLKSLYVSLSRILSDGLTAQDKKTNKQVAHKTSGLKVYSPYQRVSSLLLSYRAGALPLGSPPRAEGVSFGIPA